VDKHIKLGTKIDSIFSQCLVLEDAPSGVTAARRAGMQVILVPDERVSLKQREGATQVLNSLLEFRPEDFGLPPFDDSY